MVYITRGCGLAMAAEERSRPPEPRSNTFSTVPVGAREVAVKVALLRPIHNYHAVPMPFPCHAIPLRVYNVSFPFDLHSAAVSDSHLPCHAHAAPMPCSDHAVLLKATVQHGRREPVCGLRTRVRLLPAATRSSTKIIRSIPVLLTTIHTFDCKECSSTH